MASPKPSTGYSPSKSPSTSATGLCPSQSNSKSATGQQTSNSTSETLRIKQYSKMTQQDTKSVSTGISGRAPNTVSYNETQSEHYHRFHTLHPTHESPGAFLLGDLRFRGTFDHWSKKYLGIGLYMASTQSADVENPVRCIINLIDTSGGGNPDHEILDVTFSTPLQCATGAVGYMKYKLFKKYKHRHCYTFRYWIMFSSGKPTHFIETEDIRSRSCCRCSVL